MKRFLLSLFGVAMLLTQTKGQFTPNNIVVAKSTGVATYTRVSTITLQEYDAVGAAVGTPVALASNFYVPFANASNIPTGYLSLSSDNQLLTMYGYNTLPGTANGGELYAESTTTNRSLAIIGIDKNPKIVTTDAHSSTNVIRGSLAYPLGNGTYGIYVAGSGGGLRYTTYDPASASTSLSAAVTLNGVNAFIPKIFNEQLYISSQSTTNISTVGTGVPTSASQSISTVLSLANAHDYVLMNNNVLYVSSGSSNQATALATDGIHKFYFNGTSWVSQGVLNSVVTGETAPAESDKGFRGMTASIAANGTVTIFAVTNGNGSNRLVKIVDAAGGNASITGATKTQLATSGSNTPFRGVAYTPGSNVTTLPVTFSKLSATRAGANVNVKWTTVSETNNDHFEIEASTDGKIFKNIKTVATKNGNSTTIQEYQEAVAISDFAAVLALPLLLGFVGFSSFSRRKKAAIFLIGVFAVATSLVACQKEDSGLTSDKAELSNSIISGQKTVYIRIKQVDKNGDFSYSEVTVAK